MLTKQYLTDTKSSVKSLKMAELNTPTSPKLKKPVSSGDFVVGQCKTCKHKLQHPHHARIGICCKPKSPHAGHCVGDSLKCKHHEVDRISKIKRHCTFEQLIKAGMDRKLRVV